ncbi:MAG: alkaline phosphatase family protein [Ignisphaera sp.]
MIKTILIVIDGATDGIRFRPTSLELAYTPGLDTLAQYAVGGCFHPIDPGTPPESDAAVFSILGYDPKNINIGRGILEALGVGIKIREGYEVAFRANFATIDPSTLRILDRRVGRNLSSEEAKELAKALDGMELGVYDGYAKVVATIGHRAVVIIGSRSKKLSANVSNTDPAYEREGRISVALKSFDPTVSPCRPLDDSEEAKITCELVNVFTSKAIDILEKHIVNIKRAEKGLLKANVLLLRDAEDRVPSIQPIKEVYGKSFGIIAEMPVEIGIGVLLGMDISRVSISGTVEDMYRERVEKTLELLNRNDVVYVHLKGPDEPGHDGDKKRKVISIEAIDRYYIQPLIKSIDLNNVVVIVTSDHCTPPELKAHSGDAVPFIVAHKRLKKFDGFTRFTEAECCTKGSLGVFERGHMVLNKIFSLLK